MPIDNDHGANYAQQYRSLRPGPFLDSESLKCRNYTCDSSSPFPSTDLPGSSESIFNAIKVTSPEGSTPVSGTAYNMGPVMEEELAANIAMFIPSAERHSPRKERRRVDTVWWRNQMLSDQSSYCTPHLGAGPFTETILAADAAWNLHRKAISLDTVGENQYVPRWPENLGSAVSTFRPQYPPPERQPTPPGLPSFNTPEAMYCSAQFLVGQNGVHHMCGVGQQTQSYGDALRRFFNLSPSNETAPGGLSVAGIGRAEDGTIVQGRFPYRQSGHGMNAGQLNDHPFHLSNLPVAENEAEQLGQVRGTEVTSTKSPGYPSRRRVRIYTPPSIGSLWPFSDSTSGSAIPPRPRKQGRTITLFGLQWNAPTQNGSTSAPSTVESSVQGMGVIGNQISPTSSLLQSAHTQAIPEDLADEELPEAGHSISNFLSWIPAQFCLCCSGRRISENRHSMEPLEVVTTGETYLTAREDQHHRQWGSSWISSLSSLVCPGALLFGQSAR